MSLSRPYKSANFAIDFNFAAEKKVTNNCKYNYASKTYIYKDEYYDPATKSYKVGDASSITSCENAKTNFYSKYGRHSPGPRPPHSPPSPRPVPLPRPVLRPVVRGRPIVVGRPYPVPVGRNDPDIYNITYNNGNEGTAEDKDPENAEEQEEVVEEVAPAPATSGVEFLNDIPMPLLLGGLGLIFVVLLMRK